MGLKGEIFEKSLFLHNLIAKPFGLKVTIEPINPFAVASKIEDEKTINTIEKAQNAEFYRCVYSKKPNEVPNIKCLDIAFIVPDPIKGSGGHRNIYRAVKFLKKSGHNLTVYYINTKLDATTVKQQVTDWFYDMGDIPFICYDGTMGYHDVCVATWWETAYAMLDNSDKIKYKFNMVQDYEPSFYPMSSQAILAENTYKQDFMYICSGPWVKAFLNNKYNARAEYFQFPVDRSVYHCNKERIKKNRNIIFFAKPEMYRRCYEIGIEALQELHRLDPELEIILFGSNNVGDVPFPATKLGILPTIDDLADLYRNADMGVVFSTTNPSLVPYEMMHCGCPVVDLDVDLALSKYGNNENNILLCDPRPKLMAKQIYDALHSQDLLRTKRESALEWVHKEFPSEDEMGEIVENIIIQEVKNDLSKKGEV